MSPRQVRRWVRERAGLFPALLQGSPKRWLIQRASLALALGIAESELEFGAVVEALHADVVLLRVDVDALKGRGCG